MRHEEIPGFIEWRERLMANRMKDNEDLSAEERTQVLKERRELREEMRRLMFEYSESQKSEGRKK